MNRRHLTFIRIFNAIAVWSYIFDNSSEESVYGFVEFLAFLGIFIASYAFELDQLGSTLKELLKG